MARSVDNVTLATRPGNNRRVFGPHLGRRRYDLFRRQFAIAEAAIRREIQRGRRST